MKKISRRDFLKASAAGTVAGSAVLNGISALADEEPADAAEAGISPEMTEEGIPEMALEAEAEVETSDDYYPIYDDFAAEQERAAALNEQLAGESFVLMKNKGGALPLKSYERSITAFGVGTAFPSYGAQGSGTQHASGFQHLTTFKEGLENAGIYVNPQIFALYDALGTHSDSRPTSRGVQTLDLTPDAFAKAEDSYALFGDAAILMLTREGGEGEEYEFLRDSYYDGRAKLEEDEYIHELMLTPTEREILAYAKEKFSKIIVLVNSTNPLELGCLEDDDRVDAIVWIGGPGISGFNSVGKLLTGEINPSGHTESVYPANFTQDPTWFNYGSQSGAIQTMPEYAGMMAGEASKAYDENGAEVMLGSTAIQTVSYLEGIQMGYRWYETQAELGNYFQADKMPNNADASYDVSDPYYNRYNGVVYPFGYGLSYTQFAWDNFSAALNEDGTKVNVSIDVTNVGDVPGKDVVEIYYSDPYYDGSIEKAAANLVKFAKTGLLAAGETQTVELTFAVKDMASFDYNDKAGTGFCGYKLEAGDYVISARKDSHTVMAEETIALDAFDYDGSDAAHNYNDGFGVNAEAIFSSYDSESEDFLFNTAGDPAIQEYVTRAGGVMEQPKAVMGAQYSPEWVDRMTTYQDFTAADHAAYHEKYHTTYVADDGIPASWTQAEEGAADATPIQLKDMVGVGYPTYTYDSATNTVLEADDEATAKWDEYLNQLTLSEMKTICGSDHGNSAAQPRFGMPKSYCNDGPSKLQSKDSSVASMDGIAYDGTWWTSEPNITSSWNTELAYQEGLMIADESLYEGVTGMWGFGLNTHRGPWGARAFEYYAEDAILAGYTAAAVTKGCVKKGVIVYNKHYALNDQDEYRNTADGAVVFTNEQALRQIYLKPYEIAVKEGGMNGAMMSFMRCGTVSCDNNYNLIDKTLRGEWGFKGDICTDAGGGRCGDAVILAGNDWPLMSYTVSVLGDWDAAANKVTVNGEVNSTQYYAIRKAAMHFLYGLANSNAMKNGMDVSAFTSQNLEAKKGLSTTASVAVPLAALGAVTACYTLKSGLLPAGISLASDGTISGTPTELGTSTFTVRLTADSFLYTDVDFTMTVGHLFDASCLEGKVGDEDFECLITSEDICEGDEYASVSYAAEGLPEGLVMAEDGTIYGTPEAAGSYPFTVTVTAEEHANEEYPSSGAGTSTFSEVFTLVITEE